MRFIALLFALLLSGCATTVAVDTPSGQPSATVVGQMDRSRGMANWRLFVLLSVNDKPVSHSLLVDRRHTVVEVPAGVHKFVVEASFNSGFGSGGPWEAIVLVEAKVEAGRHYRINGDVRGTEYFVWLEDEGSGAKVSSEYSSRYSRSPSQPGVVPIFIPVR